MLEIYYYVSIKSNRIKPVRYKLKYGICSGRQLNTSDHSFVTFHRLSCTDRCGRKYR